MAVKRRSSNKNPPILSHEFFIQNHADIVASVAMIFMLGLMFKATSPLASLFIALQHNVTISSGGEALDQVLYEAGLKDLAAVFFYVLIMIVAHQIIQEYVLDRVNRKLHLSKVKHAKFNESGQLLSFYLLSVLWAGDLIFKENLYHVRGLWDGYPHTSMTFTLKLFYMVQLSYWLHVFPELYFQKVKREDMAPKVRYASLYLLFIGAAYCLNYTRVGLVLIAMQYVVEGVFHACRVLSYLDKAAVVKPLYRVHEVLFVLARLGSITLAVLTFWYGLSLVPAEDQVVDVARGIYNTVAFRVGAMVAVGLLQAWQMFNFITFHIKRMREKKGATTFGSLSGAAGGSKGRKSQQERAKARKDKQPKKDDSNASNDDEKDLPEVDQNTKSSLRQRK